MNKVINSETRHQNNPQHLTDKGSKWTQNVDLPEYKSETMHILVSVAAWWLCSEVFVDTEVC